MYSDSFHIYSLSFLVIAILWCIFWSWFDFKHSQFYESIILILAANFSILITAILLSTVPSLIHNEYHNIQAQLSTWSILINFFSLIGITLFKLGRQKLMNPLMQFKAMYVNGVLPITFLIIVEEMKSYGVLTSLNFSLVFDVAVLYLLYSMIIDIYECEITTILSKFIQALPLKLFMINEIAHIHSLLSNQGHTHGGDEIRLMIGYIVMLIIINLTFYFQATDFIKPRRIRTDFGNLSST